ncbi:TFIID-31kDa-domain-containing protein [Tothia fuscella]|uniref:TFIID-31kDa-domain-containing protein n=1 Tax=Tothia fuscella TaxID=1048955 RepID=A0A9P4U388_9PEZI|nr:TFIID-31kDa-domain-containing protein [Tothia fuscella]
MTSPNPMDGPNGISTPPSNTQNTALGNPSPPTTQTSTIADAATPSIAANGQLPAEPALSFKDDGLSTKRPRDARLIHLLLAAQGVQSYQERVPLMIMDFAYRYTSGILSDAMALTADGYGMPPSGRTAAQEGTVTLSNLRLSIGSRQHYQFQPSLPKEVLLELAQEKNRVTLPKPDREFGIRLPPERYTFTGSGWGLKEEWESEDDGEEAEEDMVMGDVEGGTAEQEEFNQEEFEEVMGGGGGGGGGDSAMADA